MVLAGALYAHGAPAYSSFTSVFSVSSLSLDTMASATENNGVLGDPTKMEHERRSNESSMRDLEKKPVMLGGGAKQIFRPRIIAMACIVSMGGFSRLLPALFSETVPLILLSLRL